jgi:hypothetical protein
MSDQESFLTNLNKNYEQYLSLKESINTMISQAQGIIISIQNNPGYPTHGTDNEKLDMGIYYKKILAYLNA